MVNFFGLCVHFYYYAERTATKNAIGASLMQLIVHHIEDNSNASTQYTQSHCSNVHHLVAGQQPTCQIGILGGARDN